MTNYEFLGNNLKRIIKERGLTVKELSKRSGIGEQTIRDIINAKRRAIRMKTIYNLCVALKTKMKELTGF